MTALDHRRSYPRLPHPPRRIPIVGDVFGFDVDAPSRSAADLAKLGPVYEFRFFGAQYIVAAGAEAAMDLNDETRFAKHIGPDIEALRIIGGDGLFTAYNDEPNWLKAHQLLMPALSQASMRRYHGVMLDVAGKLTDRWDNRDPVDVSADTTRVILETIGRCAAGYSFGCFDSEQTHPFVEHMVSALRDPTGSGRCGRHSCPGSSSGVMSGGSAGHDDLLAIMLASDLDTANIRYQLINFLVAGHETTSGALSFALYFLSQHPEECARARAEVDEVWGDWALALTITLHRDPHWGPDPDRFGPDRFLPERVHARPAGLYKPFGTGERSCIGRQFALHEAVLLLGVLLRRYDLTADPGYQLQTHAAR